MAGILPETSGWTDWRGGMDWTNNIVQGPTGEKIVWNQAAVSNSRDRCARHDRGRRERTSGVPPTEPKLTFSTTASILPSWHRVKLPLLKSIPTSCFIDIQPYAYHAIANNLPLDPRPRGLLLKSRDLQSQHVSGKRLIIHPTLTCG